MKTILCECGKHILIDDEDFLRVSEHKWSCKSGMHMMGVSTWTPLGSFILYQYGGIVDHKDRDNHNNQKANLRPCTKTQNNQNASIRKDNTCGYKGVTFGIYEQKYKVRITVNKVRLSLGAYSTAVEAAEAYNKAAIKYFGEFASLNQIPQTT